MRSLCKWAGVIADEFGLSDWSIQVHEGDAGGTDSDHDAVASVSTVYGRKIAHITISPEFVRCNPEEQRHVILHEFLHIHTRQARDLIYSRLPQVMGEPAFDAFASGLTLLDELAIDAMASAIERFYPLWEGR